MSKNPSEIPYELSEYMERAEEYLSRIADAMEAIKEAMRPLLIKSLSDEEIRAIVMKAREEGHK